MMNPFALARALRERGVLGLNARNGEFMLPWNPRRFYPLVDDKVLTKTLAREHGVSVPEVYAVIEIPRQIRELKSKVAAHEEFVVKPARGSGGEGIVVVTGRGPDGYRKIDGSSISEHELEFHISNILAGIFSLGGTPDKALVEYRVNFDPVFDAVTYRGVPDVRVIVFLGVPVMAMVRLPTRKSGGRANLHQGALGTGVDMATGKTLSAVLRTGIVDVHPDTGVPLAGIQIPHWQTMLEIATRSYELTGLGYQGVDIVLDRKLGPMVLELNARPGLAIQMANRSGLRARLEAVLRDRAGLDSAAARITYARERFAARPS
ncbi:MAG: alpha-L-glutamate ligase-like protein [Sphingomonadaceae bacterium]